MAFEEVTDRNAQRAEQGGVGSALQVQGQHSNQTLEGLGGQDVTSAVRTAKALSTLANDLVGNASAIKQKEDYVEAYANAGAGRSVQELRDEQPAWTTLFGPSATVQGAQARALQTATANLGNEGLAMVEANKDKDPAEFHKMLAQTVGKHLTGDSSTDTLITQKSTELVTEIAAAHYKANAKYVQELNVQTSVDTINANFSTLKTMLAMPADQQSESGVALAKQTLQDSLSNTYGMNKIAHQSMLVGIMNQKLSEGDATIRDMLLPSLRPSTEQAVNIQHGNKQYTAIQTAKRKAVVDTYTGELKQGTDADVPDLELTPTEQLEVDEATKKYWEVTSNTHRATRAAGRVSLIRQAEGGVGTRALLKGITQLEAETGPLTEGEYKEILGAHEKKNAGAQKLQDDIWDYKQGFKNAAGEDGWHMQLKLQYPGIKGEQLVIQDVVTRNQPGGNEQIKYQYSSHLGLPILPNGKPNPAFGATFEKFQQHYQLSPASALGHITDPVVRAQYIQGMKEVEAGTSTPAQLVSRWSATTPIAPSEVKADPDAKAAIAAELKVVNKDSWYNIFGIGSKPVKNSRYVEDTLANAAAFINRNGNRDVKASVASAAIDFHKQHEVVNGTAEFFGATPFITQMGLVDNKVTTDEVLEHYKQKLKLEHVSTVLHNGVMTIQQTDKNGHPTGEPVDVSFKSLGAMYNTDVTNKNRATLRAVQGADADVKKESTIQALLFQMRRTGYPKATREQATAEYNKVTARKAANADAAKKAIGKAVELAIKNPIHNAGVYGREIKKSVRSWIKKLTAPSSLSLDNTL